MHSRENFELVYTYRVLYIWSDCLDANVQIYDHWGPEQQRFDIDSHGNNVYSFRTRITNRALDVTYVCLLLCQDLCI